MKLIIRPLLLMVILNLTFFLQVLTAGKVRLLTELDEHQAVLRRALTTAKKRVVIVSPFISKYALLDDDIPDLIEAAQRDRGVSVTIYTDDKLDQTENGLKWYSLEGRKLLTRVFCNFKIVNGVHAKLLIVDDEWMVVGSFNWLSASRDGPYQRVEHSVLMEPDNPNNIDDDVLVSVKKAGTSIDGLVEIETGYSEFYNACMGHMDNLLLWLEGQSKFMDNRDYEYLTKMTRRYENKLSLSDSKMQSEKDEKSYGSISNLNAFRWKLLSYFRKVIFKK